MTTRKDLIEFALLLGREVRTNPEQVMRLLRMARSYQTLAVNDCNRGLTDKEEARREGLRVKIKAWAKYHKCGAVLGGDPRGAVVKLKVPSGATNDRGKEGVCVPV